MFGCNSAIVDKVFVLLYPRSRMKYASGFIDRKSSFWSELSNTGEAREAPQHTKIGG